ESDKLFEATLDNGAHVLADNLKILAFVKSRIKGKVSSFDRSKRALAYMKGKLSLAGTADVVSEAELDAAAQMPENITPAYTDGYGNVKLAITHDALREKLGVSDAP